MDDEERTVLRSILHELESGEGSGHELISLYIPPDKPITDVKDYLKEEYTRSETIQDTDVRRQVQHDLSSILSHLKNYDKLPGNGLAIFCGAGPEKTGATLGCTIIEPPEPLTLYLYRHSRKFEIEPIRQMLEVKSVYGLLVLDLSEAWWGFLRGDRVNTAGKSTSGIPDKQRKGGQSSARFQRLRKNAITEFFSRVGHHASGPSSQKKTFSKGSGAC
jgi:peptide chain release factor subunit 1